MSGNLLSSDIFAFILGQIYSSPLIINNIIVKEEEMIIARSDQRSFQFTVFHVSAKDATE